MLTCDYGAYHLFRRRIDEPARDTRCVLSVRKRYISLSPIAEAMFTGTQQEPLPVIWHSLDSLGRVYGRHELVVDEKSRRDGYLSARGRDGERHWLGHCVLRRMDEGGSQ